jgi:uncharacterized protein YdeI (YjbR/CyaY-like superfamily)
MMRRGADIVSGSPLSVNVSRRSGTTPRITFFRTPADLRRWFAEHHNTAKELWVGYYKRDSGQPSITWPESVDEALCCGWIDGIRKRIDEHRYTIRFTPRRPASIWSTVNIRRAHALIGDGRMLPAGLEAFEARREHRSGIYAYEQRPRELVPPYSDRLRKNKAAWAFFNAQPPWYRRTVTWWILSAKKEETRLKRLRTLISDSAAGRPVGPTRPSSDKARKR